MFPVLPMLVPQVPGVDAAQDETGDNYAVELSDGLFLSIGSQGPSYKMDSFRHRSEVSMLVMLHIRPTNSSPSRLLTTGGCRVSLHRSTFSVESIVCWSDQLGSGSRELLGGAGRASLDGGSEGRST